MSQLLSVSLPDDLAEELESLARSSGMTKSELVRSALRQRVRRERFAALREFGRDRARGHRSPHRRDAGGETLSPGVACDTNVLVSAFIADGPPSRLIEEALAGSLELVLLEPAVHELAGVLAKKFGFGPARLEETLDLLLEVAADYRTLPDRPPPSVTGDRDDDLILACAVEAGVEVLVSGDRRHLLPIGTYRGIRILTPQALLAELRGSDRS